MMGITARILYHFKYVYIIYNNNYNISSNNNNSSKITMIVIPICM